VITFDVNVDVDLLDETIAIERGCCSFFTLDYDTPARRLSIGIDKRCAASSVGRFTAGTVRGSSVDLAAGAYRAI
jgi:hypothetical protein